MFSNRVLSSSLIVITLLCLSSQPSFAATQPANNSNASSILENLYSSILSSYVMTLSVGPIWNNNSKTQTLNLASEIEKTYASNHLKQALVDAEFFFGVQKELPKHLQGQVGFEVAVTNQAKLSGDIWDDGLPQFNNYTYHYHLRHTHLAVKGKLLLDNAYPVTPWISASIGVGFNSAKNFSNTPTIFEAVASPNFSSNTTTTFTYTIGAGFQRNLTKNWQAGIGYEFADWGSSHLGRTTGQTQGNGPSLSHFYTNGFFANITYAA